MASLELAADRIETLLNIAQWHRRRSTPRTLSERYPAVLSYDLPIVLRVRVAHGSWVPSYIVRNDDPSFSQTTRRHLAAARMAMERNGYANTGVSYDGWTLYRRG